MQLPPETILRRPGGLYFKVERALGGGAMGNVYVVRDPNLANRRRVIKVLHADAAAHPPAVERFVREARAMARLQHPNIAAVEDIGMIEDERGRPKTSFYVMPYVEGESVRSLLARRRRLPPKDALALVIQAATALVAMHGAGVIHCDIKPDNMVVTEGGKLVVIDFGVMHLEAAGEREGFYGTFAYASDHQVAGKTPRREDDLFALSMVLYELLAGVRAFSEHGSGPDAARARAGKKARPLRDFGIDHALLETLVEGGIDPDDKKRWTDAEAMLRALKRVATLFDDKERAAPPLMDPHLRTTRHAPLAHEKISPTDLADPTVLRRVAPEDEIATVVPPKPPAAAALTLASAGVVHAADAPRSFKPVQLNLPRVPAPPRRITAYDLAMAGGALVLLVASVAFAIWIARGV